VNPLFSFHIILILISYVFTLPISLKTTVGTITKAKIVILIKTYRWLMIKRVIKIMMQSLKEVSACIPAVPKYFFRRNRKHSRKSYFIDEYFTAVVGKEQVLSSSRK